MGLRWSDIDLNAGKAILRETKNEQTRVIPIQSYALELIIINNLIYMDDNDTNCMFHHHNSGIVVLSKNYYD